MGNPKVLIWIGSSKKDLLKLPPSIVDSFGYALYLAQSGGHHPNAKALRGFGDASVVEVVEAQAGRTYRAVYTIRFTDWVFVLHVFQKKSKSGRSTPRPDMEIIRERLKVATQLARTLKQ